MAYSAILIPELEKDDAEVHATKDETSWIGESMLRRRKSKFFFFFLFTFLHNEKRENPFRRLVYDEITENCCDLC